MNTRSDQKANVNSQVLDVPGDSRSFLHRQMLRIGNAVQEERGSEKAQVFFKGAAFFAPGRQQTVSSTNLHAFRFVSSVTFGLCFFSGGK